MTEQTTNPIEELYTSSGPIDEKKIVDAIKPYVAIQRETNTIYLTAESKPLSVDKKILVYALAKKLLGLKDAIEDDSFSAVEIHKETALKKGSIDGNFKKLREKDGFLIGKGKKYEIAVHAINDIINLLGKQK